MPLYELQNKTEQAIQARHISLERIHTRLTKKHPFNEKIESKFMSLRGQKLDIDSEEQPTMNKPNLDTNLTKSPHLHKQQTW